MQYVWRRIGALAVTLVIACTITFAVFNIVPGDPAMLMLGTEADPEVLANLRRQLGLDLPLHVQYFKWLKSAVTGDLGISIRLGRPVAALILERLPVTASLAVLAMALTVSIGVPAGAYGAFRRGRAADYLINILTQVGLAIPHFWLGILLILLFSMKLRLLPPGGFVPWDKSPWQAFLSLVLPAFALASHRIAQISRITRSAMLDVLHKDYIRTARGKGLPHRMLIYKHALKNSLIPVVTVAGMQFAGLLAGSIVAEEVFALPGLGRLLLQAIGYRDLPLVQGISLFIALVVVVINFITDVLYLLLDPRVRYD
ncbi:MAG TPA: ABC transporter permease [Firmicutes bacterium]|nr:ABC transporter permease [Bacillota bacterium]